MRSASLLLACAAVLGARAAAAEAPARTSSLGWVRMPGAEACIGSRELAVAVEGRLGRAAFVSPAQAEVQIEGRVEAVRPEGASTAIAAGFRAHVTLVDARGAVLGTRQLDTAAGCRALDEELALVIALLIDPDASLAPKRTAPPPPRVEAPRAVVPIPAAAPAPSRPWRQTLALGPALAVGLLPRAGVGLSLRGEIEPPAFVPIELGGVVWLDARADAASGSARGAALSLAYGMLGVCPLVWGPGSTRVRGCAEMEIGAVRAVGYGFSATQGAGQEQPVAQASLAGRVTQRLVGPLDLGLGLALVVPFNRPRFFYVDAMGGQQELYRFAPVAGVVDAAVGLAFP